VSSWFEPVVWKRCVARAVETIAASQARKADTTTQAATTHQVSSRGWMGMRHARTLISRVIIEARLYPCELEVHRRSHLIHLCARSMRVSELRASRRPPPRVVDSSAGRPLFAAVRPYAARWTPEQPIGSSDESVIQHLTGEAQFNGTLQQNSEYDRDQSTVQHSDPEYRPRQYHRWARFVMRQPTR
jgi:hypothetical protein